MIDREVLVGVRRGDAESLGTFFDLVFDRIYGLAYRLLGDRMQAEDVTQDVCYRIQRGARRLDTERDPGPWILTTTVNACRSYWRSKAYRARRASVPLDPTGSEGLDPVEPSAGPAEQLMANERRRLVSQAVFDLAEPLREVVILHDYQGLDHKESASVLGVSHEAVRKRYSRALAELAQRLNGAV